MQPWKPIERYGGFENKERITCIDDNEEALVLRLRNDRGGKGIVGLCHL